MTRRDPVTHEVYFAVRARDDHRCVGQALGFPGACYGRIELDHVHPRGFGLRGASTPDNLVSLCQLHHRWKTENGREARAKLDDYLHRKRASDDRGA